LQVVHHLEKNPDGKSFPGITKSLKEVYRVLKPGGVLTITTVTPKQIGSIWFTRLLPENTERWCKRVPNHKQLKACLEETGFSLKSAFASLMPSHVQGLDSLECILSESWRNNASYFDTCTETDIQEMTQKITRMKDEGTLQEFFETHHQMDSLGGLEILAAKKEI
jgi:ubiquinone/menaquinone biosynthesis C-methylase UbiE